MKLTLGFRERSSVLLIMDFPQTLEEQHWEDMRLKVHLIHRPLQQARGFPKVVFELGKVGAHGLIRIILLMQRS
jgi:hypothetical protein